MMGEGAGRIQVYVDSEPRWFYLGLRVRHAIGSHQARRVERGECVVRDGDGDRVDLDGALYDGEQLYIRSA